MSKNKRKLQLLATLTILFLLAFSLSCTGFFVNPTLTGVQVGPTASIQQTKTIQESATGTYDDGTTKTLSSGSGVVWSIADSQGSSVATISDTGLVTGTSPGQATVTGAVGTLSGTSTITVTLSNLTSIQITPKTATITSGQTQQYAAMANGGTTVITNSVLWTLNAGSVTGVSIDQVAGLVSTTSGDGGTVTIQASDQTTGLLSNVATLTIAP
jgi:trimeric autotransporter adhesin